MVETEDEIFNIHLTRIKEEHPEWDEEKQIFVARRRVYWVKKVLNIKEK